MKIKLFHIALIVLCLFGANYNEASAQTNDFQFEDLDDVFKKEIRIENEELSKRISKYPETAIQINSKIANSVKEKKYEEALKFALEMDSILPNNGDIKNFIGKIKAKQSNFEEASYYFNKAISLEPYNKWFYINAAVNLAQNNQYTEAVAIVNKLNKLFPNWGIGYNLKATLLRKLGDSQKAISFYDKAIVCQPNSAQIIVNRGDLYLGLNNKEKAIVDYQKALEIQPNYKRALDKLNVLLK